VSKSTLSLRGLLLAVAALCALLGSSATPAAADTALGVAAPAANAFVRDEAPAPEPLHWQAIPDELGQSLLGARPLSEVVPTGTARSRTRVIHPCRRPRTPDRVCLRARERAVLTYSFSLQSRPSRLIRTGIAPPAHAA